MSKVSALFVDESASLLDVLGVMNEAPARGLPAGIALVGSAGKPLRGVVTDGDIRRGLVRGHTLRDPVSAFVVRDPIVFPQSLSYIEILRRIPKELDRKGRYRHGSLEKLIFVDDAGCAVDVVDFYRYWQQQQPTARAIAVLGLGYVGLTLGVVMAEVGYQVLGIEQNPSVRESLAKGVPHFSEAGLVPVLRNVLADGRFHVHASVAEAKGIADVYIITVGTPIDGKHEPVLSDVRAAAEAVSRVLKRGDIVILRSTVQVGTCRDVVKPILEKSGLAVDREFLLAFAPERTLEGKALEELRNLPQVIGGHNREAAEKAASIFRELTDAVIIMNSLEEAEMVKLVNNSFRDLSFAFANELSLVCEHFNMDAGRIIRAANEGYPRNPVPLPSPGVGGACLTKDPYLYGGVARRAGLECALPVAGRFVNELVPRRVADRVVGVLREAGRSPESCRVLLVGVAFKGWPETSDFRQSTTLDVLAALRGHGVRDIRALDAVVDPEKIAALGVEAYSAPQWREAFKGCHAALFLNNHPVYAKWDIYDGLRAMAPPLVIFDGWQIFDGHDLSRAPGVHVLGSGIHHRPPAGAP
ncbi:MAG: nucleotide sugar dehydrogenase [Planctomycetia bacterium]|nr:nucleotide sugar dehydrogenase [Planctomycetia bacterium]